MVHLSFATCVFSVQVIPFGVSEFRSRPNTGQTETESTESTGTHSTKGLRTPEVSVYVFVSIWIDVLPLLRMKLDSYPSRRIRITLRFRTGNKISAAHMTKQKYKDSLRWVSFPFHSQ